MGRASECATVTLEHIEMVQVNGESFLSVYIHRGKNENEQHLHVVPHRNNFMLCWYFTFACNILVGGYEAKTDYIFPLMAELALKENEEDKVVSRVSGKFTALYKSVLSVIKNLREHSAANLDDQFLSKLDLVSDNLSSHCAKKLGINMANCGGVLASYICDRAGWVMNNVHTFFDYVVGIAGNDLSIAKVLSAWIGFDNRSIGGGGGLPPLNTGMDDARAKLFVQNLFYMVVDHNYFIPFPILSMLAVNILRFMPDIEHHASKSPFFRITRTTTLHRMYI